MGNFVRFKLQAKALKYKLRVKLISKLPLNKSQINTSKLHLKLFKGLI